MNSLPHLLATGSISSSWKSLSQNFWTGLCRLSSFQVSSVTHMLEFSSPSSWGCPLPSDSLLWESHVFNSLLWELGMEIQPANTLLSEFLGHVFFAFQLLVWLLKTTMAFWFLFLSIKHFLSPFLYVSLGACRILSLAPCSEMSLLPALKCISYRHSGDPFNLVTYVLHFG